MENEVIRLEALKLAHTHGKALNEVLATAKEYELFILGPDSPPNKGQEISANPQNDKTKKVTLDKK